MIHTKLKRVPAARAASVLAGLLAAASMSAVANAQTTPAPNETGRDERALRALDLGDATGQSPTSRMPTGVITLREALALALLQNPRLAAFSWETRVREAEALQAGLLPNPEIVVEAENFLGNGQYKGYESAETTVFLGQLVELGRKRSKRRAVAELERELADWDYEVQRLDVLTAVTQAFVAVLEAQERFALTNELRDIAVATLDAVARRVDAGAASSVEQTRADVSASTAAVDQRRAAAQLESSRLRLSALWGEGGAGFSLAEGQLSTVIEPPPIAVVKESLANNPDLARWVTELAYRDAAIALADAGAIPNITAGVGVRRLSATDNTAMVAGITVPLPVFDRNQGTKRAARHDRSKSRSEQRAMRVRVEATLAVAYERLRANYDVVVALRERVIPQAARAYEGVQAGYQRGLFRYVDVLESQRTLFELRDRELVALASYHNARAEVERLIGEPIGSASSTPSPPQQG